MDNGTYTGIRGDKREILGGIVGSYDIISYI
jgi:hypothetical protein